MENEFPPNSRTQNAPREQPKAEKKEVKRVTRGKVVTRKKPLHRKLIEALRPADNKGFAEYVLLDMLVPSLKDAVADASTAAIDNALGVSDRRGSRRRSSSSGYTTYNRMSAARPSSRRDREDDRRPARREPRPARTDHREFVLDTRVEADEVIDNMFELISKYEVATLRDLLSLMGEPHEFTDEDWGWTDLRGARIHKVREGYLLDLPRPEPLD